MNRQVATPTRVLLALLALVAAPTVASAKRHPAARTSLLFHAPASAGSDGAKIDPATGTVLVVPPQPTASGTFVEFHSARVENDLMLFKPTLVGIAPEGSARNAALLAHPPTKPKVRFFVPAEGGDPLEVRRDRDRLVLFRGPQSQGGSIAVGLGMFAATTILSAHLPRPLRVLFDGPVHLGPAVFDGGGMGAGIAGRGL